MSIPQLRSMDFVFDPMLDFPCARVLDLTGDIFNLEFIGERPSAEVMSEIF